MFYIKLISSIILIQGIVFSVSIFFLSQDKSLWYRFSNLLKYQLLIILTFILLLLPYFLTYGSFLHVSGPAVNDAVTHAVLGRSCVENKEVQLQYYFDSFLPCASGYPNASHAFIRIISIISGIEPSKLVNFISLYLTACSSLFFIWIIKKIAPKINWQWQYVIASVLPSSYLLASSAYYGFYPQTASLALVITTLALISFQLYTKQYEKRNVIVSALLVAASGLVYSVVALLPILVFFAVSSIIYAKSLDKIKFLALVACTAVLFFLVHPSGMTQTVSFIQRNAAQSWVKSSQDFGHLTTFVSPLIISGVWFEPDYRYESKGIRRDSEYFIAISILVLFLVGSVAAYRDEKSWILLPVFTLMITAALTFFITSSPYSVLKILYYLSPFVMILAVYGGHVLFKSNETFFFTTLVILIVISSQHMVNSIGGTPFYVLDQLADIKQKLPPTAKIRVEVDTPWSRYYLDNGNTQFLLRLKDGELHQFGKNIDIPEYIVRDKHSEATCKELYVNDLYVLCAV